MSTDASRYYEQTNGDDLTTRAASAVSIVSNVPYAILGVAPVAFEGKDNNDKLFDVLVLTLDITGVKKAIEAAKAANATADSSMEVLNSAEDVEKVTKTVTSSIDAISSATEEQSATMEQIAASTHNLSELAEVLKKELGKFKF